MQAFGRLLRVPQVTPLFVAATLGRLPYGMESVATVLFVQQETGSFATAGIVSATMAVAAGAGLPVLGRLIDMLGQTRVLVASAAVHVAFGAALIALVGGDAPTVALCAAGFVCGFFTPPLSPALRSLWSDVLGDDAGLLRSAMAVDAIAIEVVFIGGPLLAAVIVAVASPGVALAAAYAVSAAGALSFASMRASRRWKGSGVGTFGLGPLRSRGLLLVLAVAAFVGVALGTLEVALPALGVAEGSRSAGAMGIAAIAVGSAIGGLVYGARQSARLVPAFIAFASGMPVGVALLALADSVAAMLLLAPIAGLALAPFTAAANELAGTVVARETVTEAYAWVITATIGGFALGIGVGGSVVEAASWREAVLVGAGVAAAGAVVAFTGRRALAVET